MTVIVLIMFNTQHQTKFHYLIDVHYLDNKLSHAFYILIILCRRLLLLVVAPLQRAMVAATFPPSSGTPWIFGSALNRSRKYYRKPFRTCLPAQQNSLRRNGIYFYPLAMGRLVSKGACNMFLKPRSMHILWDNNGPGMVLIVVEFNRIYF